jgi:hypothetical protein
MAENGSKKSFKAKKKRIPRKVGKTWGKKSETKLKNW